MKSRDASKRVEKAYRVLAKQYKRKVRSEEFDHRFIEKFLAMFSPGQRILDIGAGTGIIAHDMFIRHQLNVVAIDSSKEMLNIAKKQHPELDIRLMDMRKLTFADKEFDGAFANYSLIHIREREIISTLRGIARVLKPKAYLYLSLQEPITKMQKDGYYPVVYNRRVKMFINLFKEKEMRIYLRKTGFKLLWVERRNPHPETEFPFNKLFIVAQKKISTRFNAQRT
jgi:ubiquinone/menaquinone biosynthesis C-methylase UbiE